MAEAGAPRGPYVRGPYVRGTRRREQIVDAARQLFVTEGYRAVSLRDIAAAAGLTHPGLLRHFAGKEAILDAVVDDLERANHVWIDRQGGPLAPASMVELAEHNATIPGYVALFTMLAGEASSAHHPAHDRMRRRYEWLREQNAAVLGRHVEDPRTEATRLAAVWDGLQLLSLYDPSIDVPSELARWLEALLGGGRASRSSGRLARADSVTGAPVRGSVGTEPARVGSPAAGAKKALIIDRATELFASRGFHETSLQDVADAVGSSKSGLLYHFPTKEALLEAVLRRRDAGGLPGPGDGSGPADLGAAVEGLAGTVRDAPGLIEAHAVLCCEATAPDHPAHQYFRDRLSGTRTYVAAELARAALRDGRQRSAATSFVALWEGLQFQWLYDRGAVDVPALLAGQLRRLGPVE
ncbi:TetR/AcrR family transcriptional regulator [Microlunatus ginsengisoli]|uniref:HTH tetR-type domain-containing protein n=1 Tax=Microlunatus ginsengisoli TaxID=363863 RepID=A0ABP6ZVQ0_9ACTN